MNAYEWLKLAVESNASDIFIGAGRAVSFKINGVLTPMGETIIDATAAAGMVAELYALGKRPIEKFMEEGDDDFPITAPGLARFRVSVYNQRGTRAAVLRVVLFDLPKYQDLNIPDEVMTIANEKNGLVLVTGPAGSGKTTTLACIIDAINKTKRTHIITLEDPIEYLHRDKMSLISQREISTDTKSYLTALRACLRQTPDIILLGEMRDIETMETVMMAAETGHLVISTLHTMGAANTIDRIIDSFPHGEQQQVRTQLATILRTVVSQQLLIKKDGKIVPAFEIMHVNKEIRKLIRESETYKIDAVVQTSSPEMISIDTYIMNLVQSGDISMETALEAAANPEHMSQLFDSRYFDSHRESPAIRAMDPYF
ncbi:MAG: PilT/PilU family type 4a pilus ATPase [Defluviitaleaceae bacterium]|nr:PilT/PilU family type 4a pilus ATPase [Defluviitaleaceae bacterium]